MNINALIPSLNKFQNPSLEKIGILCTKPTPDFSLYLLVTAESSSTKGFLHGSKDMIVTGCQIWAIWRVLQSFPAEYSQVQREVRRWFRTQDTNFFVTGILKLVKRWDMCI